MNAKQSLFQKIKSIRFLLWIGVILSFLFAAYSFYYKITYWGFSTNPKQLTNVWTIEAHVSFFPTNDPIKVSIARPVSDKIFKILDEDIVAPANYQINKTKNRIELTANANASPKQQDLYYRLLLYDYTSSNGIGDVNDFPKPLKKLVLSEQEKNVMNQISKLAEKYPGDSVQRFIHLLNQTPPNQTVQSFLPEQQTALDMAHLLSRLLTFKKIPNRLVRGMQLEENKKSFSPDILLEAYQDNLWTVYNITTGEKGLPDNFVIFQRDGNSLIDVEGGIDSLIQFSVLKSVRSSFSLAKERSKESPLHHFFSFENSIYNLPLAQQNSLKWLMVFPLAILMIVLMRNVIGLKTMGTFTPMLISMALIQTGFFPGLICFGIIIGVGFTMRALLSRFNLLLVPRISAVVIFVILLMQIFTVWGYQFKISIASSALFFPIIIMAWIIERGSITWEEEGSLNALKEILWTLIVAIVVYFVVADAYIRYLAFAFNEFNLVILFIVMLLGTYTGYRLTELVRFAPLRKRKKRHA